MEVAPSCRPGGRLGLALERPGSCLQCKPSNEGFREIFLHRTGALPAPAQDPLQALAEGPADRKNFRPPLPEGGEDLAARGREGPLDPERLAAEAPSEGEPVPLLEAPGLDVWERRLAQSAARPVAAPPPFDPTLAVLRRCLASGDGRSGRVRLELGEGAFEGSAVDVVYDGVRRELSVVVELGAEADGNVAERLASLRRRLLERGLPVGGFQVLDDAGENPR